MTGSEDLAPPREANVADPGAHQLSPSGAQPYPIQLQVEANPRSADHSDSEDQFTDAPSAPRSPESASFVPKATVEKVSDEPVESEIPGTEAYKLREADAKPDAISVIPDEETTSTTSSQSDEVPATVVEESSGTIGPHSAEFQDKRQADPTPDIVIDDHGEVKSSDSEQEEKQDDDGTVSLLSTPCVYRRVVQLTKSYLSSDGTIPDPQAANTPEPSGRPRGRSHRAAQPPSGFEEGFGDNDKDDQDAFGDDFDDFEEGAEDDDFGDFGDEGFQQPEPSPRYIPPTQPISLPFVSTSHISNTPRPLPLLNSLIADT